MQFSHYQTAIFDHVRQQVANRDSGKKVVNLVVKACAGAGKSFTAVKAADLLPVTYKAMFLAFNKNIADELKARLPEHVQARTLNSLGMSIWSTFIRGRDRRSITLDKNKTNGIVRDLMKYGKIDKEEYMHIGDDVRFLVGMAKSHGIVPEGAKNAVSINGLTDTTDTWVNLLIEHNKTVDYARLDKIMKYVRLVLNKTLEMEHVIDFDDQKYFPAVKRFSGYPINAFKYDALMVDEAQDLNAVDFALIQMSTKKNSIVVAIGDDRQAIYFFRGAGSDSMNKFKSLFGAVQLPLSITYRCAKSIVETARQVYPEIEAAPNAKEGEVKTLDKYTSKVFSPSDMVICRNNAPLIGLAYKLIADRVPVIVRGRDIGQGLIRVIDSIRAKKVPDLVAGLEKWRDEQVAAIIQKNNHDEELQRMNDLYQSIMIFVNMNDDGLVESVKADIDSMFSNTSDKDKVVLSSMHRSKGLEADTVFILDEHLMYPVYVSEESPAYAAEKNLDYVAKTRAKNRMFFIRSDEFNAQ